MAEKINYEQLKRSGFVRQKQDGYFSLRLHVVGGSLTAENFAALSKISRDFGNGDLHLTSRQSVEVPFIKYDDIEAVRECLSEENLEPASIAPCVRTVTACPGSALCRSGNIDTQKIAKELDRRYFGVPLPHKFKFGVTGCRNNCLKAEENDVGIKGACEVTWLADPCIMCGICERGCPTSAISSTETEIIVDYNLCISCGKCAKHCPTDSWETQPGFAVFFGGQFGNTIEKGKTNIPIVKDEEQLYRVTDAAINYFKEHGKRKERLGKLFERIGREEFDACIQAAYNGSQS